MMRRMLILMLVFSFVLLISATAQADEITGLAIERHSSHLQWSGPTVRHPIHIINEDGLNYAGIPGAHDAWPDNTAWTSDWNAPIASQFVVIDMEAELTMDDLLVRIWNNNEPGWTTGGVQDLDILVSTDDISYTLLGSLVVAEGPADNLVDYSEVFSLATSSPFRYVMLDVNSNHGAAQIVGLCEVKLYANEIPEPMTILLMAGGAVMASIRRRFR